VLCLGIAASCDDRGVQNQDQATGPSPENVFFSLQEKGLTCDVQKDVASLDEQGRITFVQLVKAGMTDEQLRAAISARGINCQAEVINTQLPIMTGSSVEASTYAITNTYAVEQIEEQSTSGYGWMATSVYRDGTTYGNMCGNDWPTDYIAEFNGISGGYSNRSSLRITGLNGIGSCFIPGYVMARVYSDDSIRACIGYWHVFFCSGGILPRDMLVWRT
jgi:hypothetical protein